MAVEIVSRARSPGAAASIRCAGGGPPQRGLRRSTDRSHALFCIIPAKPLESASKFQLAKAGDGESEIVNSHEENLSAQQDQARQKSWLQGPHGHARRAPGAGPAARERPAKSFGLNSGTIADVATSYGDRRRFPRTSRLLEARDYRAVFSAARFKVSCRHFLVLAISGDSGAARLGLVVSRKNVPGAVQRNRLKRLIRENFRRRGTRLHGMNLVVLARKDAHKHPNPAIHRRLNKLLDDLLEKARGADAGDAKAAPYPKAKRESP